jgi:hypothetical protein
MVWPGSEVGRCLIKAQQSRAKRIVRSFNRSACSLTVKQARNFQSNSQGDWCAYKTNRSCLPGEEASRYSRRIALRFWRNALVPPATTITSAANRARARPSNGRKATANTATRTASAPPISLLMPAAAESPHAGRFNHDVRHDRDHACGDADAHIEGKAQSSGK